MFYVRRGYLTVRYLTSILTTFSPSSFSSQPMLCITVSLAWNSNSVWNSSVSKYWFPRILAWMGKGVNQNPNLGFEFPLTLDSGLTSPLPTTPPCSKPPTGVSKLEAATEVTAPKRYRSSAQSAPTKLNPDQSM